MGTTSKPHEANIGSAGAGEPVAGLAIGTDRAGLMAHLIIGIGTPPTQVCSPLTARTHAGEMAA